MRMCVSGELLDANVERQALRQRAVLVEEGGRNMEYLRHVVTKYMEMENAGEDTAPLFQVTLHCALPEPNPNSDPDPSPNPTLTRVQTRTPTRTLTLNRNH